MPDVNQYKHLYAYHFDTILRLMSSAGDLSEKDIKERLEDDRRTIQDTLFHLLGTDRSWRLALETGRRPAPLQPENYPDLAALRQGFKKERSAWDSYLAGLLEDEIDQDVELRAGPGRTMKVGRWKVLQHVLFHGMQHQAELAQLLTNKGRSPGDIDLIFYS
jgi:uncharacterized damage-inducible protein DinB